MLSVVQAKYQYLRIRLGPCYCYSSANPEKKFGDMPMKLKNLRNCLLICLAAMSPMFGSVIYDNGGWDGSSAIAYGPDYFLAISDSFTVSANVNVTGINFVTLMQPGDSISSTGWSITSLADSGTSYGSDADATSVNTLICASPCALEGYDEDSNSISGLDVSLAPGTYYLNLFDPVSSDAADWALSNGASAAFGNLGDGVFSLENFVETGSDSEAFQILGSSSTPEPGTILLAGLGAGFLALLTKFRRNQEIRRTAGKA